jgi:hypothetical protein
MKPKTLKAAYINKEIKYFFLRNKTLMGAPYSPNKSCKPHKINILSPFLVPVNRDPKHTYDL